MLANATLTGDTCATSSLLGLPVGISDDAIHEVEIHQAEA